MWDRAIERESENRGTEGERGVKRERERESVPMREETPNSDEKEK